MACQEHHILFFKANLPYENNNALKNLCFFPPGTLIFWKVSCSSPAEEIQSENTGISGKVLNEGGDGCE